MLFPTGLCNSGRNNIEYMIESEAIQAGLDPKLVLSIAKVESGLNPNAKGTKGEIGVFQIRTQNVACPTCLYSPNYNIKHGVSILRVNKSKCSDMGPAWFICFNNGMFRRPKYPQLHPYYKKVMAVYGRS